MRRRRAATTSSLKPWTGRSPFTDGKSTILGSREPPPCTADNDDLHHLNITFRKNTIRSRHPTDSGEGKAELAPPKSHTAARDSRSTVEPRWSAIDRGREHRPKKPHRRHHHLHSAAGRKPTHPYTITRRIRGFPVLPPPERQPEDGKSAESTAARWSAQESPEIAFRYCEIGRAHV